MFNTSRDAYAIAAFKSGHDINPQSAEEVDEVVEELKAQKPLVQAYVMDEIFDKMIGGEAAIGVYYSGEAITMIDDNPDLAWVLPEEGSVLSVDCMAVPAASEHKDAAEMFINFMCETDIGKANSEYIGYTTPMHDVWDGLDEDLKTSEIAYPSEEDAAREKVFTALSDEVNSELDLKWSEMKSYDEGGGSYLFLLLLAMLAFRLAQAHATPRYTYGYKKSAVLISLLNSVILLVAVGVIVAESVGRMLHPAPVEGGAIAWTAGVGVVINGFTAWLFMKDKDKDLNVKGAYLHMAADALVSVGVLVSGVVISWAGWTVVDPVVGLVVAAVIVASVWSLTRDSLRLSLDGVPVGIRIDEVEKTMEAVPGVKAVHHIHVWAISTTENALTAHVVLAELPRMETVKRQLKAELETAGIHHVTLEFESSAEHCPGTRY